ncbi:LOW QUALITY PROTEIN: cohesin subunit SA-3-like, partial [Podargus strigoides]
MALRRSARVQGGTSSGSSPAPGSSGVQGTPPLSPPAPDSPDLSSGDSGSDFEDTLRQRRKRGPQRVPSHSPVSKRPRRRQRSGDGDTPEQNTLFEAVVSAKVAVEAVVDEWLETYKQDREGGFLELINFIVRSCG